MVSILFFLDVCILLPQTLKVSSKSCEKFLEQALETCCISSSVYDKTSEMLDTAYDWVSQEIQEKLYPHLQSKGVNKLTPRDARVFEEFFNERRKQLAAIKSPSMHFEMLSQIEQWTVDGIHKIKLGESIQAGAFLATLLSALSAVYESLRAPFEAIEVKNITPKYDIRSQVALLGVKKYEDMVHLASAIEYQFSNNIWVVFITFDEKHILHHQRRLLEVCALHCCKPDYAMDYSRDISREDRPIQYYSKISPKSSEQQTFAKVLENSLHLSITVDTQQMQ